ncbi:hypothetical protein C1646_665147 [Rhizophagus diaphanus]|nr:hypothetical protein C1646_665147 [Rhizophagus diaphanus] [Rhizophagus sp. MUCL 43196]
MTELKPEKETIKEISQFIVQENLDEEDIKLIAKALVETASTPIAGSLHLSSLRKELQELNVPEKLIKSVSDKNIIILSNELQIKNKEQSACKGIHYPDHFLLESVKERLDAYDVSTIPDVQALADVIIMLCIRPAEIKNLHIKEGGVTGYAKNKETDEPRVFRSLEKNEKRARQLLIWIQEGIESKKLRDPEINGTKGFNTFLKKKEFIPDIGEPLLPSSLRKLKATYVVVVYGATNLTNADIIAGEALRHSKRNYESPTKRCFVVLQKIEPRYSSPASRPFLPYSIVPIKPEKELGTLYKLKQKYKVLKIRMESEHQAERIPERPSEKDLSLQTMEHKQRYDDVMELKLISCSTKMNDDILKNKLLKNRQNSLKIP